MYKPPKVSRFPALERGYYVQCPGTLHRKTAVSGGHIRINGSDPLVSRHLCFARSHGGACALCRNKNFEVVLEKIGDPKEFQWIDRVLKMAAAAVDFKVTDMKRTRGDCCVAHRDTILVEVKADLLPTALLDKETSQHIYDMIMKASNEKGVPHEVLHIKFRRHPTPSFDMVIAIRIE